FVGQDDLPLYDSLDRINKRNLFVYGISNRLLGKFATTPATDGSGQSEPQTEIRELARLSVTHAYDPVRRLSEGQNHFSDVDVYARLTPLPYTTFTLDSTYDAGKGNAITTRVGTFVSDPRPLPPTSPLLQHLQRSTSIGLSYRHTSERLVKQFDPTSDISPPYEVDANIIYRLNEAITGAYIGRYDLNTSAFIGNRYFVRYFSPQHCWFVDVGAIDKVNPREFEFRFMFTLIGLSSSGRPAF